MILDFELLNAEHTAAQLFLIPAKVAAVVDPVVIAHARMLETEVKRNASGRPGPNAPTGNYRRSWTTRIAKNAVGVYAAVGTNAPQGRRLEYGFHGTDALGRHYNQPPFPHAGPAMDKIKPQLIGAVARAIRGIHL